MISPANLMLPSNPFLFFSGSKMSFNLQAIMSGFLYQNTAKCSYFLFKLIILEFTILFEYPFIKWKLYHGNYF